MSAPRTFRTVDVEEAAHVLSSEYSPLSIRPSDPSASFEMRVASADSQALRITHLTLSHARISTRPLTSYVVALPAAGPVLAATPQGFHARIGGSSGIVASVGSAVTVDYLSEESAVLSAQFDKQALEDELSAILGRPITSAVEFAFELGIGAGTPTSTVHRVIGLLDDELTLVPAAEPTMMLRRRMDKLAMAALLLHHRHNYSDEINQPAGFEGPRTLRNAVQIIEENPQAIVTIADLARATHMSVRALEAGFRRHLGTPPMAYLRDVRLRRVHDDLLSSTSPSTTATELALKWGFSHYGRFAAAYKDRFGSTPAETLRGRRRS